MTLTDHITILHLISNDEGSDFIEIGSIDTEAPTAAVLKAQELAQKLEAAKPGQV
jgi:hypothetical protein